MSRFAALASPPSSRSSSVERDEGDDEEDKANEVVEYEESDHSQSESKKENRPVEKESVKFSLSLESDNLSPVHWMNGYAWRMHVDKDEDSITLEVQCDIQSSEVELWLSTATIEILTSPYDRSMVREFSSWQTSNPTIAWFYHEFGYWTDYYSVEGLDLKTQIVVKITPKKDGVRWSRRHAYNLSERYDGIIKIGEDQKQIKVHREFLARHSPYFLKHFYEDYKTTDITEISLTDVDFDLFAYMIRILYDTETVAPQKFQDMKTADFDIHKLLELCWRFEFKIVEDRCIAFLLSSLCTSPIHERLLMSEQKNLSFLTENLLKQFKKADIVKLCNSVEFDQVSPESLKVLFNEFSVNSLGEIRPLQLRIPREASEGSYSITVGHNSYGGQIYSPFPNVNGFPWRLKIVKEAQDFSNLPYDRYRNTCLDDVTVYLICNKAYEAELWKCTAAISCKIGSKSNKDSFFFSSWDQSSHERQILKTVHDYSASKCRKLDLEVTIKTEEDGKSYSRRHTLDPHQAKDGILVFEEEKKKIEVNKQALAAHSAYFDRLFFGSYMEKTMAEIPIGDVKYTEFFNIMLLLYGSDTAHFHCKNALRMLQLADRFELKILEDRAVALLLSPSSSAIPMPKKLLIADQYFLPFLMEGLISQLKSADQLKELSESPEWLQFSPNTHRLLFQKFCF